MSNRKLTTILSACLLGMSLGAQADGPTGNLFFYSGNPETDADAYPYVGRSVPGYITDIVVPFNGSQLTVARETATTEGGFAPTSNQVVNQTAPTSSFLLYNQVRPDKSVTFFGELGTYDLSGAHATPNAGVYLTPQRIRFNTPDGLTTVAYSLNGGGMQPYDGTPITIVADTTLTYQGTRLGSPGPLKTVVYTIDSLPCSDIDGDGFPDRIEVVLGTDPFLAEGDANGNTSNDFDEYQRGAATILPKVAAPDFVDNDGDSWSNYDELLRQTATNDAAEFPAAPGLDAVELSVGGTVASTAPGIFSAGAPNPAKPYPDLYEVTVLNPGGHALSEPLETGDDYTVRTSGEQFHLVRAKALDGSGRSLLAVVPPRGLCIDTSDFCDLGDDADAWRAAYRAAYEATIYQQIANQPIDPRTTAAAFLLNRYYEVQTGADYLPGVANMGPDVDVVFSLRSQRNEAELFAAMEAAVTPAMVELISDYFKYATSPSAMTMTEQLASIFAGQAIDPDVIPVGVRTSNFSLVSLQTAGFFANLSSNETLLTGELIIQPTGFELDVNGTIYRLTGLADTFAPGSTITVRALIDVNDCNFGSPIALVKDLVSRSLIAAPAANDSDMDGMDDDWELLNFGDLDQAADDDYDNDGIDNKDEQDGGTNPKVTDSPIFASYRGDADLSQVVNAVDLVNVQNNLGADYSCVECRGRGDADGNRFVTQSDLDAVGEYLFVNYPDAPSCSLIETPCNGGKSLLTVNDVEAKGLLNPTLSLVGLPSNIDIDEVVNVTVTIDTAGQDVRALSTRIVFDGGVLELVSAQVDTTTFDVYTVANPGIGSLDLAGLASVDRNGSLVVATMTLRGKAQGLTQLAFDPNDNITTAVYFDGNVADAVDVINKPVGVDISLADRWILF